MVDCLRRERDTHLSLRHVFGYPLLLYSCQLENALYLEFCEVGRDVTFGTNSIISQGVIVVSSQIANIFFVFFPCSGRLLLSERGQRHPCFVDHQHQYMCLVFFRVAPACLAAVSSTQRLLRKVVYADLLRLQLVGKSDVIEMSNCTWTLSWMARCALCLLVLLAKECVELKLREALMYHSVVEIWNHFIKA